MKNKRPIRLVFIAAACTSSHLSRRNVHAFQLIDRPTKVRPLFAISDEDEDYMDLAIKHARRGSGHTFPNPAVGCVLVRQDTNEVIGSGFHPRAGFPHAEIFALFEACGHVHDGVSAAQSVIKEGGKTDTGVLSSMQQLSQTYASPGGAEELFANTSLETIPVTAYVTLEPCCHYGKTPPCASTFVLSKVNRVVVGFRDPNPRVDGGGIKILQEAGIDVDMAEGSLRTACAELVTDFVKRVTPREEQYADYSYVNGAMRSSLRSLAGRKKVDGTLAEVDWNGSSVSVSGTHAPSSETELETIVTSLNLDPTWLERVDSLLWDQELVLLRLKKAVDKKKAAKLLGERIALQLQAHVAQTVGHTVLLYRPGLPPILDLAALVEESQS